MPSPALPEIANLSAAQAWVLVCQQVGMALESPHDQAISQECEDLVKELGPQYEEDPEAVSHLLQAVGPVAGLNALLAVNPSFNLNDPLPEIVRDVVEALGNLQPDKTTPPR